MPILPALPLTAARDLAPVVVARDARLGEIGKTIMLDSVIYLEAAQPLGPFVVPTTADEDTATRQQLEDSGALARCALAHRPPSPRPGPTGPERRPAPAGPRSPGRRPAQMRAVSAPAAYGGPRMIVFATADLPVPAALVQEEHEESVLLLQSGLSPAQVIEALRLVLRDVERRP